MIAWPVLQARANADGEFRLHARFWEASICLQVTDNANATTIIIRDGAVASVVEGPAGDSTTADVLIAAPRTAWLQLLERVPRPFYQDLLGAVAHHGFTYTGAYAHARAYYPAVRRLIDLMRETRDGAL